jgi:hypothetical protein
MKFNLNTIYVWLAAFVPILALAVAVACERWTRKRMKKPPQKERLLRPAGHSIALELDRKTDSVLSDVLLACCATAFASACLICFSQFFATYRSSAWTILFGAFLLIFAVAGIFFVVRAFRRLQQAQNLRLGMRGEQAVAEALHEIGDCGFRAFHDFPGGEDWNIDHIAVGAHGVFLIETKARSRRISRNGQAAHEVVYDGQSLKFPFASDSKPIEQAIMNATWLANYLEKKTGEPVRVEPIVVLPGWYVRFSAKGNFPVRVMNAGYLGKYLRGRGKFLQAAQVRRIIAAIDEKCRDVEF